MKADTVGVSTSSALRRDERPIDPNLCGYIESSSDIVTRVIKPVRIDDTGARQLALRRVARKRALSAR